jgi:hypothetical protein
MGWFSRKSKPKTEPPQPAQKPALQTVFFTQVNVRPHLRQLASNDDAAALHKAISALDPIERLSVVGSLALPPVTSTKVATLSLEMFDPTVVEIAIRGLWQLLLSKATPAQIAVLERIASPTVTDANYAVGYGILSDLMTSSLGRALKVGEMENVRHLVAAFLKLSPGSAHLYSLASPADLGE